MNRYTIAGRKVNVTGDEAGKALRTISKRFKKDYPPKEIVSKRDGNAPFNVNENCS